MRLRDNFTDGDTKITDWNRVKILNKQFVWRINESGIFLDEIKEEPEIEIEETNETLLL